MQQSPEGDVMASLLYIFQDSIEVTNSDKQYFPEELAEMNAIAESMEEELEDLVAASGELEEDTETGNCNCEESNKQSYIIALKDLSGQLGPELFKFEIADF